MKKTILLLIFAVFLLAQNVFGSGCVNPIDCTATEINEYTEWALRPINLTYDDAGGLSANDNGGVQVNVSAEFFGGNGTYCNGTRDQVLRFTLPDSIKTAVNYTVSLITYGTQTTGYPSLLASYSTVDTAGDWRIFRVIDDNSLRAHVRKDDTTGISAIQASTPVQDTNSPELVALRVTQTNGNINLSLFVNGTFVASDVGASAEVSPTNNIVVCGNLGTEEKLVDLLVGMAFINISLSDADISDHLYNSGDFDDYPFTVAVDSTPPVITIGVNNSAPRINDVINISFNVSDDTAPTDGNLTINWTSGTTITNFSLSADTDLHNVTKVIDTAGNVLNLSVCFTDAADNYACNSTKITVNEDVLPIINASHNISLDNIFIFDVVNLSFNVSDNLGLLSANISINFSAVISYVANFSLSGTDASIFNITEFTASGVFNVTGYVTDNSNNVVQNSTLIIVQDNIFPVVNQSTNASFDHLHIGEVINFSCNITDETGLQSGNITHNMTDDVISYAANFSFSGEIEAKIYNVTEITVVGESVINVTCFVTDENNNVKQNSTLYEVGNTNPTNATIILPTPDDYNNTQPDYPFEVTFAADIDGDPLIIYYYIDGVLNQTSATNTTFNASDGHYKLNVSIVDVHGDSSDNASVNFTIDTTVPTLLVFNMTNNTRFGFNINETINITMQDSNPFNLSYTLHNKSDDGIYSEYNDIPNSTTTIMLVPTLNLTGLASGNYTIDINFSDRHTKENIELYDFIEYSDGFDFETAEGSSIEIKQKQGSFPYGLKTEKLKDRYTLKFGTTKFRESRMFEVKAKQKIEIIQSGYKGHLIIGKNWMDFENGDSESIVTVERKTNKKVEVYVYSNDFNFRSLGGLNVIDNFYNIQIDNHPPTYPSNSSEDTTPLFSQDVELSAVCSDIIAISTCIISNNQSGAWSNTSNVTVADGVTNEINHSETITITASAGSVIGYEACANDTFNQFTCSGVFQTMQVNDTTSPTISGSLNISKFFINSSLNASFGVEDDFELNRGMITITEQGVDRIFNFSLTGTKQNFTQNFTISPLNNVGDVITIVGFVNDTFANSATETITFSITKDFFIDAFNAYDNTTILNFTATLFNDTFSTTTSTIDSVLNFTDILEGLYNVNLSSDTEGGGYLNVTITDHNVTNNLNAFLPQAIVYINASRRGTIVGVLDFNVSVTKLTNISNATGGMRLLLNASDYRASVMARDYFDTVLVMNLTNKSTTRFTAEPYDINLSVEVFSISDSAAVGNFTALITGNGSGFTEVEFVNEGNATYSLGNNTYTIDITPEFHSSLSITLFLGSNETFPNVTMFVLGLNSINFTIFDEVTELLIPENVSMEISGPTAGQNLTITGGVDYIQDLEVGENRLTFSAPLYTERDHYITIVNGSNNSITLYLLSITNGTDVTFTVQDNSGNPLEHAQIKLKRYYVSTNSYRTVAMSKSNFEGESVIDTDFNDAFYETFTTFEEFTQRTVGARMIATTFFITLNLLSDPFQIIDAVDDVTSSMAFNNLTETFSYTFSVLGGTDRTGTIEVYKLTPTDKVLVCENSDTSSGATILCQYNTTSDEGTYIAEGIIQANGGNILDKTLEVVTGFGKEVRATFGEQGIFFTVLILGTLAGLGAFVSPAIAIILFIVGLGISVILGFTMMNLTLFIGIAIMGFVIAYKMKS